jgi:hypothetical protein
MKTIKKFQADDGTEFTKESDCIAHEALCAEIDEIMRKLPNRPDDSGCKFSNGYGFLQHDPKTFWAVRDELLRIGNRLIPHKWFDQALEDRTAHPSWVGRLIGESSRPLDRAWSRIMCVDSNLREWGQPFYANNPDKVELENFIALKPGKKS